jgi:hypothetical protein
MAETLGKELGNAELAKPESEMHPVALWHRRICALQAAHRKQSGAIFEAPETGAARAYLDLAYNLYLIEQNAELQKILLKRLRNSDQFRGAVSETRVAGMLVRAGFSIEFEDEGDSNATHCEYTATRQETGKTFSVEVKTKHWTTFPKQDDAGCASVRKHVTRLLRDALKKDSEHERLVMIELALPDESLKDGEPKEPWWLQSALDGIRFMESALIARGKPVPAVRVIVCNHPWHLQLDSTRSIVAMVVDGIGPNNFRSGHRSTIREAARLREEHADFLALWKSIEAHRHIPQTFDGTSHHLAHGTHAPRLIVGQRYRIPVGTAGTLVDATLEQAFAMPESAVVSGIYLTDNGQRVICNNPMTEAEVKAYKEHPSTFFGVVQPTGSITDPVDWYHWFLESYRNTPKEKLIELLGQRPDIEQLRTLPQRELAEIYCESLASHVNALGQATKQDHK